MPGVEILSSQPIYQTEHLWWIILVGTGLGFIITLIAAIIDWVNFGFTWSGIVLIFFCTFLGFFISVIPATTVEIETDTVDYVEYKVTIDDTVLINEFLDKYEILDQDGKIYTIKERE